MKFWVLHLDNEKIEEFEAFDDFLGNGFLVDKKTNERVMVQDSTGKMTSVALNVNKEPIFVSCMTTLDICLTKKIAFEKSKTLIESRIENLNVEKKIKKRQLTFKKVFLGLLEKRF